MMRKWSLLVILALMAGLLLVGCGGGGGDSGGSTGGTVQNLTVAMHDIYFGDSNDNEANPPKWEVTSGNTINVTAKNEGALEHNWAVVKLGETLPATISSHDEVAGKLLADLGNAAGGATKNLRFTAPAPGEYMVICTVAGHYPAMQGRLIVK